jgi:dethiobiotin synthetase
VRGVFVTGTDTGVGKTYVASAFTRYLRAKGCRVFAFKPIETGCLIDETGARLGDDQRELCRAAGDWQEGELRGVYRLATPVAPSVAARAEGVVIDLERVARLARAGAAMADVVVVEGAGGWRAPIDEQHDMADLARAVGLPVIVVGRATLGTINHTLLTLEAVQRDGCEVAAVVLSRRPDESRAFTESNVAEISRRWGGPVTVYDGIPTTFDLFHVEPTGLAGS